MPLSPATPGELDGLLLLQAKQSAQPTNVSNPLERFQDIPVRLRRSEDFEQRLR